MALNKSTKLKTLRKLAAILALALISAMILSAFLPQQSSITPDHDLPADKLHHIIFYYVLSLLIYIAAPIRHRRLALTGLVLLGFAVEALQPLSGRHGALSDVLANLAGIMLAMLPVLILKIMPRA